MTKTLSLLIVLTIPPLLAIIYVFMFGVNLPLLDQWSSSLSYVKQLYCNQLEMSSLMKTYNEHFHAFPRIIWIPLAVLTGYNVIAEMYAVVFSLILLFVILIAAFRYESGLKLVFLIPLAFLVFGLRQHESLLWGHQLSFVVVAPLAAITFYSIKLFGEKKSISYYIIAVICSLLAAMSHSHGALTYLVGSIQLFILSFNKKIKISFAVIFCIFGIIIGYLHFLNLARPEQGLNYYLSPLINPFDLIRFFLTLLGGALFNDPTIAPICGLWVLITGIISCYIIISKGRHSTYFFWLSFLVFALLSICSITFGRSH
ncbi:MAG: hypothetical protein HY606_02970, partial [Planctomycetes bacterium]|nr:hypothetical protein [Planctomycetota bacterium]